MIGKMDDKLVERIINQYPLFNLEFYTQTTYLPLWDRQWLVDRIKF